MIILFCFKKFLFKYLWKKKIRERILPIFLIRIFTSDDKQIRKLSYLYVPAPPPERPPESELSGANLETTAFVKPAEAPEKSVVAPFISGPMLLDAAWIFLDTKLLINSDVRDLVGSIP